MPRGGTAGKQPDTVGAKTKAGAAPAVTKAPLKATSSKETAKEALRMVGAVADAGGTVDLVELQKKRKELADQLRKCETQVRNQRGMGSRV